MRSRLGIQAIKKKEKQSEITTYMFGDLGVDHVLVLLRIH